MWIAHQRDSEHDLAGASLDHQQRQELDRLEEVLARRELQQDIAVLQAESAASRRDVEQEQELNRLEEVRARRELQQDIAALQAESAASRRDVELEQELNRLEEVRAKRELQQDIAMLQRDWLEAHSVERERNSISTDILPSQSQTQDLKDASSNLPLLHLAKIFADLAAVVGTIVQEDQSAALTSLQNVRQVDLRDPTLLASIWSVRDCGTF